MINEEKVLVIDIDGTICPVKKENESYMDLLPYPEMVKKITEYKTRGFYIILNTARNMKTFQGNVGRINAVTLKNLFAWLDKHGIPYDEVHVAKPWAGKRGFYIDDRAVRPSEFLKYSEDEIINLLKSSSE